MVPTSKQRTELKFALQERFIEFAASIIGVVEQLPQSRAGVHVATQLLRSGTSPASNYAEALSAESRRDFIHKLGISLKELRETYAWLMIIKKKDYFTGSEILNNTISECDQLIAILVSSVNTARKNLNEER